MSRALVLLGVLSIGILAPAPAQQRPQTTRLSQLVVRISDPVFVPCRRMYRWTGPPAACLRIYAQVYSKGGPVVFGWLPEARADRFGQMARTWLTTTNGAQCTGFLLSKFEQVVRLSDNSLWLGPQGVTVTKIIPMQFNVEFECDRNVTAGEPVTIVITLGEAVRGNQNESDDLEAKLNQFSFIDKKIVPIAEVFEK